MDALNLPLFADGATWVPDPEMSVPRSGERAQPDDQRRALGQWMTPMWVGQELVRLYYPDLSSQDFVVEPTCGDGALLSAVPAHVAAMGCEIDPVLAARARLHSGRPVIVGDIRQIQLERMPTAILANPPFEMNLVDAILDRAHGWLPRDGRAGFLLPAYALQTPSRVRRYNERWSLQVDMLPKTLFPRLSCPLIFAMFRKDQRRELIGLALFREAASVEQMSPQARETLRRQPGTWRQLVEDVLRELGGRARLPQIYAAMEGRRPSTTTWWKEKVRQVLQVFFCHVGPGEYALAA